VEVDLPERASRQAIEGDTGTSTHNFALIVLDVDGTMVDRSLVISPRLQRVASRAREAGAITTIATGRMLRSARSFALKIGANGPAICYQGAITFLPQDGQIIRHRRLGSELARETLLALSDVEVHVNVYIDDEIYVTGITDWAEGYADRMGVELNIVESLLPLAEREPTLILAVAEPDRMNAVVEGVQGSLGGRATVTHSLPHFCEIGSVEARKDGAVAALAATMGIGRERVVAFGDGEGDASMLEWAGLGISIDGGHPDALAAGDSTAGGPETDGVARALEDLLARGMI